MTYLVVHVMFLVHLTFHGSHTTQHISWYFILASILILLTVLIRAETPNAQKLTLLNKAFAENLVRPPTPNENDYELKAFVSAPPRTISSLRLSFRWLLVLPVHLHQQIITHQDGDVCNFQPSCSHFALKNVRRHGLKGLVMASDRLLRCYSGNHKYYPVFAAAAYDPVPSVIGRSNYPSDEFLLTGDLSYYPHHSTSSGK